MKSMVINTQIKTAISRKGMKQSQLAKKTNRANSTINGYANTEPAPIDAMADIAEAMNDSLLSQDFANMGFGQFPSMNSDVFQDNVLSMEVIHGIEATERKSYKQAALIAVSKNKENLDKEDKEALWNYAMNFLDEIFIELRYVISLLDLLDMSLMQAIKQRRPLWVSKRYLKK
ncbi:helix-turn-helix transcriptional regulator [Marinilactibacillus sp. Marseille-P9653]|uniref:helix-turn-helix domain-containing protein n=1 Tax=Marinilactibacillus sp. Marseille-P9653 TaxID=2866583 RepID=UPI001CE453F1|nr:helix-turn-helix transcriptional regulator [Marinilactibacillus sp. Marseille-P9653]